jgi:phenylpropionate dioxygenase-like ring-hydroxylating dioxygenase large terminal subunit
MITKEENETLTRVGPGTPGGEMLRRYWWPVELSEYLKPKDRPTKIRVLGENLVLFREGSGPPGLLALNCSHRGTSLEFGRVADKGIRCCYPAGSMT